MTDRPIVFSGPMVLAILAGTKTQTRRVVKPQFTHEVDFVRLNASGEWNGHANGEPGIRRGWRRCPYGAPGMKRLWGRETHRIWCPDEDEWRCRYAADGEERVDLASWDEGDQYLTPSEAGCAIEPARWRPSIYMPRWASRLTLEVTGVRVERLQAITEEDAVAEGAPAEAEGPVGCCRCGFIKAWARINGKRPGCSWAADPWVWVVAFRRLP